MGRASTVPTTVVGTGRLARSLVPLLGRAGHPVAVVVGRKLADARTVARGASPARATISLGVGAAGGRLILLAVPDRAIAEVARRLVAAADVDWRERVVLHHAGALDCAPLAPLRRAGAAVGLLHPLQSLGVPALAAETLAGSRARIDGDRRGRAAARRLALALGLVPLNLGRLSRRDRAAYHAAASVVGNDLLPLLAVGVGLLESLGLRPQRAIEALLPLARGTLRQIERAGLAGPLTGPSPRGDVKTLRAHLARLAQGAPEDREIHRLLSLRLARLALERGERAAAQTIAGLAGPRRQRGV